MELLARLLSIMMDGVQALRKMAEVQTHAAAAATPCVSSSAALIGEEEGLPPPQGPLPVSLLVLDEASVAAAASNTVATLPPGRGGGGEGLWGDKSLPGLAPSSRPPPPRLFLLERWLPLTINFREAEGQGQSGEGLRKLKESEIPLADSLYTSQLNSIFDSGVRVPSPYVTLQ